VRRPDRAFINRHPGGKSLRRVVTAMAAEAEGRQRSQYDGVMGDRRLRAGGPCTEYGVEAWKRRGIILKETFAVVLTGSNSSCQLG
jgi:hypothetical protein